MKSVVSALLACAAMLCVAVTARAECHEENGLEVCDDTVLYCGGPENILCPFGHVCQRDASCVGPYCGGTCVEEAPASCSRGCPTGTSCHRNPYCASPFCPGICI
jgi:hypothetical protein